MSYRDNVDLAAAALARGDDANWELARLTYESTHEQGGRPTGHNGRVSMETWCADVRARARRRFSTRTGELFRRVWREQTPQEGAEFPSWTEAYYAVIGSSTEDKADRRAMSEARNARPEVKAQMLQHLASDPDVPPEVRRSAFGRLVTDPAIVEQASRIGTDVSRAITGLHRRADVLRAEREERYITADPVSTQLAQREGALDIEASCNQFARDCARFAREIAEIGPRAGVATEQDLIWIRRAVERGQAALGQLALYVETGRTDLDAFLDSVLGGVSREQS